MKPTLYVAAVAVLSATAVGGVYAAKSTDNDALAINDAQISLTQAVIAAEQHVGGRASRAEYEHHKGQWLFDVEVVKGRQVIDVTVNANNGTIIAAVEDPAGRDHDRDD